MRADARRNNERLVAAAREVFAKDGGGASMEAIAREAGVGVGTLYRHFPKRIDIVEAVYRTDVDELVGDRRRRRSPTSSRGRRLVGLPRGLRPLRARQADLPQRAPRGVREEPPAAGGFPRADRPGHGRWSSRRAQDAGVVRTDVDGSDLMQLIGPMCTNATLSEDQSNRLLAMVLDGLHRPT